MTDHTPLKRCTQCGEPKPATTEYFTRSNNTRDGLYTKCKSCKQTNNRAWWAANTDEINARRREAYPEHAEGRKAYYKMWREQNRDKYLEGKRRWYEANRERDNASSRAWAIANPERKRQYSKEYLERNRARIKARQRRWEDDNRERLNEARRPQRVINEQARNTRKRNFPANFAQADWQHALDYFGGCCAVCGRPPGLWHTLAMDHWIPLSNPDCPGTIPTNIVPLCHGDGGCNNSKHSRDPIEWLVWKFGKRKGDQIAAKIQAYFAAVSA